MSNETGGCNCNYEKHKDAAFKLQIDTLIGQLSMVNANLNRIATQLEKGVDVGVYMQG